MSSENKTAHLESLLTQSENEVNLLQFALKKLKKEYDQNLSEVTGKLRDYEGKEAEFAEFRKSSNQRNQEMELLRTNNEKLEAKIKEILVGESERISQTLTRNQALEKENLELYAMKGSLEEKIRELTSQIGQYKNLHDANEKYQTLTKKNISQLEEQIKQLDNEMNEMRKKHIGELSLKNEEINLLRLKIEEYSNNNKVLKQQLDQKQDMIRDLGTSNALEDARTKLKTVEETSKKSQKEIEEKTKELRELVNFYKSENEKSKKKLEEAEQLIAGLRRTIDSEEVGLREIQKENQKMQYEVEEEEVSKSSSDSFGVSEMQRDRMVELTRKCIEHEKRYHQAIEEKKRLEGELQKLKYEKNAKLNESAKLQQDEARDNFSLMISKLQLAINKNKMLNDENIQLKKEIETKNHEIKHLGEEIERFISKVRTLTIENNKNKIRLHSLDPTSGSDILSKDEIEQLKDEEIKGLREKNKNLTNELLNISKNTVNSQALNQLKHDYEIQNKELLARNEMIDSLTRQIHTLREANALAHMVSSVESSGLAIEKSKSMHLEQEEDFSKQVSDLVQKRFEFENLKQKLNQENQELRGEAKNLMKRVSDLEAKVKTLENKNKEYLNMVNLLEKEKKIKADTIANRDNHLNELKLEQNRLLEERAQLMEKVGELEELREKYADKIRFYEEYTNQMNQMNSDIIGDKELYLKTLLAQKNDIANIEKHYQASLEKITKERDELKQQLVNINSERINLLKDNNQSSLASRVKLENQSIIIANSLKKVSQLEEVIVELERQLSEYISTNVKDFDKNLPKISDLNEILDKSRLTIEDYRNFDAVKELITQQKTKYEESVRYLENVIDTLTQKYFALEESYTNDKKANAEQIDKLRRENLDTITKYENRLREQEEKARLREEKRKASKPPQEEKDMATHMEVENQKEVEEGEMPEDLLARDDLEADMENVKRELNIETKRKEKLEGELNIEKGKLQQSEEEKSRLLKKTVDLENEKVSLSKMFTMREVSWMEQKKQYMTQIEEFREEEKNRASKLVELTDKVESYESQLKKEGGVDHESREKEMAKRFEKLKQDYEQVKKSLEEKEKETEMKEEEAEEEEEAEDTGNEEVAKLKEELEEVKLKLAVLENPGNVKEEAQEEGMEVVTSEEQNEMLQELKNAIDSGSLVDILERAQSLLIAMSQKNTSE